MSQANVEVVRQSYGAQNEAFHERDSSRDGKVLRLEYLGGCDEALRAVGVEG